MIVTKGAGLSEGSVPAQVCTVSRGALIGRSFETLPHTGQKENVSAHSCLSDSTSESHGQHAESDDIIALPCPQTLL